MNPDNGSCDGDRFEELKAECINKYTNQPEKEEKETGWIIIDSEDKFYHETLSDDSNYCWYSFCMDNECLEWTTKEEAMDDGFECVKVERTYKIIE